MLKVYGCLVNDHNLVLVLVAVALCALSSLAAVNLLHHASRSQGWTRSGWLTIAAVASGSGIWATHFVAMLAFDVGLPTGYGFGLTAGSLMAAIVLTGCGLSIARTTNSAAAAWLGGAVIGAGIGVMHYSGMAAFSVPGRLEWDMGLIALSLSCGIGLSAMALTATHAGRSVGWRLTAALLLTLAICSLHFIGMGSVAIIPDPRVAVSASAVPTQTLAVAVSLASLAILLAACAALALDIRERNARRSEIAKMRQLANAAVEGLLVCEGDRIVTGNDSFAKLSGVPVDQLQGLPFSQFVDDPALLVRLTGSPNESIEAGLAQAGGGEIPVELIFRHLAFGARPQQAIAIRDLRLRKKAEREIQFLAHHDALTGLPNRSSFNARLQLEIGSCLADGRALGVLFLDLDRFKEVNDLFGHAAGDQLLQTFARCVRGLLDDSQMMARLGGDEFAIILPGLTNADAAARVAGKIIDTLRLESAASPAHALIASIGVAMCPADATDRQTLLSHADTALYRAKSEGRGGYRFFEARMGAEVNERRMIEHDLRQAIARAEFNMVYQPQTTIGTNAIVGFEALLRWDHPERGPVSPTVFIPIAEDSGSIIQIGEWVLRTACAEAASWTVPLRVAVNVSALQLHSPNFASFVHEVLFTSGLQPNRLEIEVTETALVRDFNRALATLRQLKSFGIRIAMDDFGTGYSSLSNLRAFPFDKIKIDGSFVRSVDTNEEAAAIVRAVIGLGQGLGLPVLAEGVETAGELTFLEGLKCSEAQGYHLGRPRSISDFRNATHGSAATEKGDATFGASIERVRRTAPAAPMRRRTTT